MGGGRSSPKGITLRYEVYRIQISYFKEKGVFFFSFSLIIFLQTLVERMTWRDNAISLAQREKRKSLPRSP